MIHILKTVSPYFEDVMSGAKGFELRRNDRNFQRGDLLMLCEFDRATGSLTGRIIEARVTYMLANDPTIRGLTPGFVIMGISKIAWGFIPSLNGQSDAGLDTIMKHSKSLGLVAE